MNLLAKSRVTCILLASLFFLPLVGWAQTNSEIDCNNTFDSNANDITRVAPDNMPIYYPQNGAAIIIQCPPENLDLEMPNLLKGNPIQPLIDFKGINKIEGESVSGVTNSDPK